MKLGIMQPYFFPYIGYWQLMNAVDKYVIYDDVNFIKGGWINRNRILINGKSQYFNVPMNGASSFKLINEIQINNSEINITKNMKSIYMAYHKAPYFDKVYTLVDEIYKYKTKNLSLFLINSIRHIAKYLGINTEIIISSMLSKNNELKGQDKVIDICKNLKATDYYNAIGGMELYSFDTFQKNGINLSFLKTNEIRYKQFNNEFVPNLSIIDVMMFNSKEEIKIMLNDYNIVNN
ncbi:MAG: hypothetical protein DBY32_01960 [Phascolarctobacterium sp.]|nr:MAG: hypothetical protein DBY32_01960 [Phascolarctobacterium sp.]